MFQTCSFTRPARRALQAWLISFPLGLLVARAVMGLAWPWTPFLNKKKAAGEVIDVCVCGGGGGCGGGRASEKSILGLTVHDWRVRTIH